MSAAETVSYGVQDVVMEIRIAAPPERVWTALTEKLSSWWPRDFYTGATPKAFLMEARPGGRLYEDWGDDQGRMWGEVTTVRQNELLEVTGVLSPEFGGPGHHYAVYQLKAEGEGTVLTFTDTTFGRTSSEQLASVDEGWRYLFEQCLKPFAETGAQPERPETVE